MIVVGEPSDVTVTVVSGPVLSSIEVTVTVAGTPADVTVTVEGEAF